MIPFAGETVTLIRRTEEVENGKKHAVYTKVYLTGCSWRRTDTMFINGNGVQGSETTTCRIPAGQAVPKAGDLLIYGRYAPEVTSAADFKRVTEELKADGGAFVIANVTDNTKNGAPLPHYKAR